MKDEGEKHVEELTQELEKVELDMENLRENHQTNIKQMKDKFEAKIQILETKSENLAADNFEYAVENVRFF